MVCLSSLPAGGAVGSAVAAATGVGCAIIAGAGPVGVVVEGDTQLDLDLPAGDGDVVDDET